MLIKCKFCKKDLIVKSLVQKFHPGCVNRVGIAIISDVNCAMCRIQFTRTHQNTRFCDMCVKKRRQLHNLKRVKRTPTKSISIYEIVNTRFKVYRKKHNMSANECMLSIIAERKNLITLANKIDKMPETVKKYP